MSYLPNLAIKSCNLILLDYLILHRYLIYNQLKKTQVGVANSDAHYQLSIIHYQLLNHE